MKMTLFQRILFIIFGFLLLISCEEKGKIVSTVELENWEKRSIDSLPKDSLKFGQTYLSVYTQIYSKIELKTLGMTATVTLRNPSSKDTIYIQKATFYDTEGEILKDYVDKTIFLKPMETLKIIVDETDNTKGDGANFIFDWRIKEESLEPIFESVMVSTYGKQGLSFSTTGKRLY